MKKYFLHLLFLVSSLSAFSQNYTVLGSASNFGGCNCYRLTPNSNNQAGAIFQNQTIDLTNSFDFTFSAFLGCNNGNNAADGIVFVLTNNPGGLGSGGGGLGYGGGNQPFSIGVEFDTYQNSQDPGFDHIAIQSAGGVNHNVASPVPALTNSGNIDNCQSYPVRIRWNVNTSLFEVFFNGVLRQSVAIPNMVGTYFGGNPIVNWGWTAGTGGSSNDQRICVLNTSSWTAGINYQSCSRTMQFSDISTSSLGSVQSWAWTFGDGGTANTQNPVYTYAANGTYLVTLVITDLSGCTNTFSNNVVISAPITLAPTLTPPPCNGGSNGQVAVTASGGFGVGAGYGGYTYSFNGAANSAQTNIFGGAGTYTVSVTDGVCSATGTYTLSQPTPLSASTSHTNASCGLSNGSVSISISGGTPTYNSVTWAGQSGYTVSNLPAGFYIANFNDANGCSALLQYTETVGSSPCGIVSNTSSTNVTCFGRSNGTATLNVSSGSVGAQNISWSPGGQVGNTAVNLSAGTYTYNYSDANPANSFSGTVTITQPGAAMVATLAGVNISCAGSTNGVAIASIPSGGVAPYSYNWSPAYPNAPTVTGLAAGLISVTVTDNRTCTASASITITGPTALAITTTVVNDSCNQSNTGRATANVTGGNPPYQFYWSNISSAQTNLSLGAGTYTVTVTDDEGCTILGSATITEPTAVSYTKSSQNINCNGSGTGGSITINASGGTPAYTYTWSPATATGSNPTNLSAGQYNLTLSDSRNCVRFDSINITQPATPLVVTSSHTNVTCNGASNGSLTVTVNGGTPPYSYLANPIPPGTTTLPGLPPSTYAGNVTDALGCTGPVNEIITQPAVLAITETHVNVTCNAGNSGSIDITVTGGTTPYTYAWAGSIATQDRNLLLAGTYTLTVTDANACSATISVIITQPTALVISQTQTNILCNGVATGAINVTLTGGTVTYTYVWSDGPVTTQDRTALAAATYTVTAYDQNQCSATISATITQPALLTATTSHTNVTCNGLANGTVTIVVAGGTAPYTFLGNPVPAGSTTIPGLVANTYAGNLVDANSCSVALSETITQPAVLAITETRVNVSCNAGNSGSIDITVTGGTIPYTYAWAGGAVTEDRNLLLAGTYVLTVTDANTCSATISVTITQPTALIISETHTNLLCNGVATGAIDITLTGGTVNYTYGWSDGPASTQDRTALAAATYTVTASDQNQCTATVSATITQPALLTANTSHTDVTCNGLSDGTVTIVVAGGTAPYTFLGNPVPVGSTTIPGLAANTYAGNLVDANGCSVAGSETVTQPGPQSVTVTGTNNACFGATQGTASANFVNATGSTSYNWNPGSLSGSTISSLTANTYTVIATDQNQCTVTGSYTVTQPAAVVMTVSTTDATCFGGNGSATANPAGAAPFIYTWSTTGTGQTITPLAGTYTVSAADANTCQQTATFTINQPADIIINETHTDINCNGGATGDITLTPSAGNGAPYSYAWNPNVSATNTASLLTAGGYSITVSDQLGCQKDTIITLTEPTLPLGINVQSTNITCNGLSNGSINVTASGGTPNYTYLWNPNVSSSNSQTGLGPNNYAITISDANGCSVVTAVSITEPSQALALVPSSTNLTCFQSNNGTASVATSGGTFPYVYAWPNNVSQTDNAANLAAGSYVVTVTDNNGCSLTSNFTISQPAQLVTNETHVNVLCNGDATGSIALTTTGGTGSPNYTYAWTPNVSSTNTATGLTAASYTITTTDVSSCSTINTVTITESSLLSVSATSTPTFCANESTGAIAVIATGGNAGYTYSATLDGVNILTSATGQFSNVAAGNYALVALDQNNCTATTTVIVSEPAAIVNVVNAIDATCYKYTDGQIILTTTGGVPGFTYNFSNGESNSTGTFANLAAGNYTITVIDTKGCTVIDTATIIEPDSVTIAVSPNLTEVNLGSSLQLNTTTNQSGSVTYTWLPSFGLSCYDCADPLFDGVYSQIYTANVTNQNGCVGSATVTVKVIPTYDVFIPNAFSPNGDGQNDFWQLFGNMQAFKQVEVKVFNRIGEKVFESNDIDFKWNGYYKGSQAPQGVYTYVAKFVWLNNYSDPNYKGTITLLH